MKNMFFIVIFLLLAGEAYAIGNAPEITPLVKPVTQKNVSPEAIFDQIRGFLTAPVSNFNISINTPEMPNFDAAGIQNWNGQIRDITGVDALQFLRFLLNVFLAVIQYLLNVLSRTAG